MSTFQQRLSSLNNDQRAAVEHIQGAVLVIAGPGTGKTELLSVRTANILQNTDALPSEILCLTFTEAAARNMRERLAGLIGQAAYRTAIHTFHSFGSEILSRYKEYVFDGADMQPADEVLSNEILHNILEDLPYGHIFKKSHPVGGYMYLSALKSRIGDLKRAGITPDTYRTILINSKEFVEEANRIISPVFSERLSKKMLQTIPDVLVELNNLPSSEQEFFGYTSYKTQLIQSLLPLTEDLSDTKPTKEWKIKWLQKNRDNILVLKDLLNWDKFVTTADIYQEYQKRLFLQQYYDFDDMLMEAIRIMKEHDHIRYDLQEQYQYIQVDEFQDTSGVQMALLDLLLEEKEGDPNILCVGDDDQAIYKFQGANVQHFLDFKKRFLNPFTVTLTQNYRSAQEILDYSRKMILMGSERIEEAYPELSKALTAANTTLPTATITYDIYDTDLGEALAICDKISAYIEQGVSLDEMTVIARNHSTLQDIASVLIHRNINIRYSKKLNVLEVPMINELIQCIRTAYAIHQHDLREMNVHIAKTIFYPWFGLTQLEYWQLSKAAYSEKTDWLTTLLEHESQHIKDIGLFLLSLAHAVSADQPIERIIDLITGGHSSPFDEEGIFNEDNTRKQPSYYAGYYFPSAHPVSKQYISHLSHLRTLLDSIRKHKKHQILVAGDFLEYINHLEQYHIPINDNRIYEATAEAVTLMTAHGAKGLEFSHVFVANCDDESWVTKPRGTNIGFPKNLPLSAEADDSNDALRLFYVALTRAKTYLHLSRHRVNLDGKESMNLRFISGHTEQPDKSEREPVAVQDILRDQSYAETNDLIRFMDSTTDISINSEEHALLQGMLENFQLTATHLCTFIDLEYGGPQVFLENNILRFPKSKNNSAVFGTSMHGALEKLQLEYKRTQALPSKEWLIHQFTQCLQSERLSPHDFATMRDYGIDHLQIYYDQEIFSWQPSDLAEYNFGSEHVMLDTVPISGKIDRMIIDTTAKTAKVIDYKTGNTHTRWESNSKLFKYELQLYFYKILVERSRTFHGYHVDTGELVFLEHDEDGQIHTLHKQLTTEHTEKIQKLITAVYSKIMNLDFPDIHDFPRSFKGTRMFMEALINGEI